MGFLCQAGAMNSYGDAALCPPEDICVHPSSIRFFHPPELDFSLSHSANSPQVSLAQHTQHLGRDLQTGATVLISAK